jgi:hypothetical protein
MTYRAHASGALELRDDNLKRASDAPSYGCQRCHRVSRTPAQHCAELFRGAATSSPVRRGAGRTPRPSWTAAAAGPTAFDWLHGWL